MLPSDATVGVVVGTPGAITTGPREPRMVIYFGSRQAVAGRDLERRQQRLPAGNASAIIAPAQPEAAAIGGGAFALAGRAREAEVAATKATLSPAVEAMRWKMAMGWKKTMRWEKTMMYQRP